MISQLEDHDNGILAFDHEYLDQVQDWNIQGYAKRKEAVRPWGMGRIYDSASPNNVLTAAQGINPILRTPGEYCQIDLKTGLQDKKRPLLNTNEYIHRCVRVRWENGGLATEDDPPNTTAKVINTVTDGVMKFKEKFLHTDIPPPRDPKPPGQYHSPALVNYELQVLRSVRTEMNYPNPTPEDVYWRATDRKGGLPEDQLGRTEMRMLARLDSKAASARHS